MPKESSFTYFTEAISIGWVKLGHPDPDSNLMVESNNSVSQHEQLYTPASWA